MLFRDHSVIIYDNTVRSTKITRRLNLMKRLSELLAGYAEPVTGVLGRISGAIPKDAPYICGYGSRARSILS